jgi:predicted nucleotidyltransferase
VAADEREQLDRVLGLVSDVLRDSVLGIYLHGSAVLGGLRPRSDLDLLVVTDQQTRREEKRRLVEQLLMLSRRPRNIELTIVAQPEVRPWRFPPRLDFQYGDWLRPDFERGVIEAWKHEDPDLASLLTMVLLAEQPLVGPPPAELLDPVPRRDYVIAIVACTEGLQFDAGDDTTNDVLTLARVWSTVATGEIRAKDAAATWALGRLPAEYRDVLRHARAVYVGTRDDDWSALAPRVPPHVDYVTGQVEQLADAAAADTTPLRLAR